MSDHKTTSENAPLETAADDVQLIEPTSPDTEPDSREQARTFAPPPPAAPAPIASPPAVVSGDSIVPPPKVIVPPPVAQASESESESASESASDSESESVSASEAEDLPASEPDAVSASEPTLAEVVADAPAVPHPEIFDPPDPDAPPLVVSQAEPAPKPSWGEGEPSIPAPPAESPPAVEAQSGDETQEAVNETVGEAVPPASTEAESESDSPDVPASPASPASVAAAPVESPTLVPDAKEGTVSMAPESTEEGKTDKPTPLAVVPERPVTMPQIESLRRALEGQSVEADELPETRLMVMALLRHFAKDEATRDSILEGLVEIIVADAQQ